MKRLVGLAVVVALLVALVAVVAGCGAKESAGGIVTPGGKVSVTKSGNEVTVKSGDKTTTWTASTPDEKALDFPVPSNATLVKGSNIAVSSSAGSEKWSGATYYTNDDLNTTIDFYKTNLVGMPGYSDTSTNLGGQMVGLFSIQSGDTTKSVIVRSASTGEQGKTWIQIATVAGAK
jgi:hypothetical protein